MFLFHLPTINSFYVDIFPTDGLPDYQEHLREIEVTKLTPIYTSFQPPWLG